MVHDPALRDPILRDQLTAMGESVKDLLQRSGGSGGPSEALEFPPGYFVGGSSGSDRAFTVNSAQLSCGRCTVLAMQVRALSQSLAGLSAKTFNWSAGLSKAMRRELVELILAYARPCGHLDPLIEEMLVALEKISCAHLDLADDLRQRPLPPVSAPVARAHFAERPPAQSRGPDRSLTPSPELSLHFSEGDESGSEVTVSSASRSDSLPLTQSSPSERTMQSEHSGDRQRPGPATVAASTQASGASASSAARTGSQQTAQPVPPVEAQGPPAPEAVAAAVPPQSAEPGERTGSKPREATWEEEAESELGHGHHGGAQLGAKPQAQASKVKLAAPRAAGTRLATRRPPEAPPAKAKPGLLQRIFGGRK